MANERTKIVRYLSTRSINLANEYAAVVKDIREEIFRASHYALHCDAILTPNNELSDAVLVVSEGVIVDITGAQDFGLRYPNMCLNRLAGCAIIPGFVDAHHHILDPFAKAITFGEPAQIWRRVWMPLEATAKVEDCYLSAKWTFLEAMRGGITCIVDHALRSPAMVDAANRAAEEVGIRLVSSVGCYDLDSILTDPESTTPTATIDTMISMADRHVQNCHSYSKAVPSVACGNVQTNTPAMISTVAQYCRDKNILFQIHANEHTPEVHFSVEKFGKRPIELLHSLRALGRNTLIAHATLTTPSEINLIRDTDTAISYNPVASMWKGNAVAPALTYIRQGIRIGIGSDVTRNDGFRMLDAAEACQRLAYGLPVDDFSCGAGWIWLDAATRGGARAVGLGDITGSIEVGKQADFLILDLDAPEVIPSWDLTWEMVRLFDRANILGVVIGGTLTVIGGRATRFDSEKFVVDHRSYAQGRILNSKVSRVHGPSRNFRSERTDVR